MKDIIVVAGATGNIGKKTVEDLLSKGKRVRAIARTAKNLEDLKKKGAEILPGSVDDAAFLEKALEDAQAAFILVPPNYGAADFRSAQKKTVEAYASAIEKTGVPYLVTLSSIGADRGDKVGPIKGLYEMEQRLNKIASASIVHLRPTYFMENTLFSVGLIKQAGINGSPLKGDMPIPMIATQDIARAASELLSSLNFKGKSVRELLGPKEYTLQEVTKSIGQAIGKDGLNYVQFPYEDAAKAMQQMGMSQSAAAEMIEMYKAFNEGVVRSIEGRSAKNTTATGFDEFAKNVFAKAYNN